MITIESSGSFERTEKFVRRMTTGEIYNSLGRYAEAGRSALANATPTESGLAAQSWTVKVSNKGSSWEIEWGNTNVENGFRVAIMLQYGHGTGTGGYVAGRDYINPAIQPIFDRIADDVWRAVTRG